MSSRKRWIWLYSVAIAAALLAGFNDHGLIPGLPTSIIGSILNQLVKTVGLLGVSDMVLYFRERESHDRERAAHEHTKQELAESRAAQQEAAAQQAAERQLFMEQQAAERQQFHEQQAAERQFFMEQLNRRDEVIQQLRSESRARNGDGDGNDNGHESAAS